MEDEGDPAPAEDQDHVISQALLAREDLASAEDLELSIPEALLVESGDYALQSVESSDLGIHEVCTR